MKKTIIIALIGALLICCAISALGAGGYIWYKNSKEVIEEDNSNSEENVEIEKEVESPNIETVFEKLHSVSSYKLKGELTLGLEKTETEYAYVSPNKEYLKGSTVAGIQEQITIGDVIYYKDEKSDWETTSIDRLGSFHNSFLASFREEIEVSDSYLQDEHWVYEVVEKLVGEVENEYKIYVDRKSLFIDQIIGKGKTDGEDFTIDLRLYAFADDINIESPIEDKSE